MCFANHWNGWEWKDDFCESTILYVQSIILLLNRYYNSKMMVQSLLFGQGDPAYILNLDPAVSFLPYTPNNDIR